MKELSSMLKTILLVIKQNLDIVPAIGNATEELNSIDAEERDDEVFSRENQEIDTYLETPAPQWQFKKIEPIFRKQDNFFHYFMDGTYRHYFLATGLEHHSSTPIFLAQIAASILFRDKKGILFVEEKLNRMYILLAKARVSSTAWSKIEDILEHFKDQNIELFDLSDEDILSGNYDSRTDLRRRGEVKVRWIMSHLEKELMMRFREKRKAGWFIKDGILRYGSVDPNFALEKTIGVSKRMSSVQSFFIQQQKAKKRISTVNLLKDLPYEHRTPVYCGLDAKTGFWYVRLRKLEHIRYPLFGIVKVEIPNLESQEVTTELVDYISSALIPERFVTPYGSDHRWHAHLYPIYKAEQVARQCFYSNDVIQGIINWQ
ncbi:hypothetical protein ISS22_04055 [candidate division KSB1 bacterium]|nr:hypothetical protein [candidate division KSB1 bacterium]